MVSWRSFLKLLKGNFMNRTNRVNKTDVRWSKYSAELSSYAAACQQDSDLKSFDSSLQQRTNAIITSLAAARPEPRSLSLESLVEVYGFLLELNQEASRFIIDSREDVWKNKDLKSLVEVYFNSSKRTLEFCNTVEKCVKRTEISQLLVRLAVKRFETESQGSDVGGSQKKKYAKTLEELNKIKAMGDPFDGEFVTQYESVQEQQVMLLEELRKQKVKLDKKQRNLETRRRLWNVVFVIVYVSALVLSVVAASVGWPDVVGAVASGMAGPIDMAAGKWCGKMGKKYEKAVKRQRGLVVTMEIGTTVTNESMETMRILVESLRIKISAMLETVEIAVEREDEEEMRIVMHKMKEKVDGFTEKMERVGQSAAKCSGIIMLGIFLVLDHIHKLPNHTATATSVSS